MLHDEYPALEALARLRHECETTKNLPLEGVVRPLALESFGNGLALVLEDNGSQSLPDFLQTNTIDVPLFLKLALEMAQIVGQLHWHNIIHCDIQPRHWLVHPQTHAVQLVDFGSATLLHSTPFRDATRPQSSTRFAPEAPLSGTPAYMAPEQSGRTAQSVDHRTDFYLLDEVCRKADRYIPFLKWTKDPNQLALVIFTKQMSRCLQSAMHGPCLLSDDNHDEETLLQDLQDKAAAQVWYRIVKQKLFYLNGDYEQALAMAQAAESDLAALFATPYAAEERFFHLLTLTALHAQSGTRQSSTRLPLQVARTLRRGLKQLKKWATNSEDFKHKYLLVQAEVARLKNRREAFGLYDAAVQSARECGYVQNEALANELAARFYSSQGNAKVARSHITSARYAYLKWGATEKAALLEKDPLYRAATRREDESGAALWQREPLSSLDLASVIKTSQALAGEMDLDRLIRRLMNYAMENAGAQYGLLLQKNGH